VTVELTRHGPVISETYGPLKDQGDPKGKEFEAFKDRAGVDLPENYVIALAWTALAPSTPFEAIWGFNLAKDWEDFREAARDFHVPAQNLLYADVQGNIGYQMPGDIPIRAKGDGTIPVPGWTGEYDWTGYIPFDEIPYTFNPDEGYIVTANNQVPPQDYPYLITHDWDYGFRANRIEQMIKDAPDKIDIAYIQKMQGDSFDANGQLYIPLLTAVDYKAPTPNQAIAMDLLREWDYQSKADSTPASVFNAFWRALLRNTFNDDLPEEYWFKTGSRSNEVFREIANDPNSAWWDNQSTADVIETRDEILVQSFSDAVEEVEGMLGKDPSKWSWGDMHTSTFRNGTLGESGIGPIEALFNRGPFATSGGSSIVNATSWNSVEGYAVTDVPSMRMIVDLGNLNNSVTVHTTGESGHAYHEHYDDMAPLWAEVKYYPMWWDEHSIIEDAEGHLKLTP
jgi:penicillin amidase